MSETGTVGLPADVQVLVLAAGRGSRLSGSEGGRAKPLVEVGGRPVIGWTLEWLAGAGVRTVWVNLHHQPEEIREALGDGGRYGLELRYALEPEILGTAGAWRRLVEGWTGTSLVLYGDNLMRFDLAAFLAAHRGGGAPATIALFDPDRHANTGIGAGRAVLADDGLIGGFGERRGGAAAGALVNAGAYLLEPEVKQQIPRGFIDFGRDVLPRLAASRELRGHVIEKDGFCLGLDTPEFLETGRRLVAAGRVEL